jgi:tetratricopeptide (TPR) repeat protein
MDAVAELRNKGLAADRADKILGLATGAFADGRLETASKFAQKVLRMRDELVQGAAAQKAQESPEDKRGAIENSIKEVEALGSQAAGVEMELDMARMFLEDKDFEKAMKHAEKAMALATAAGEKAAAAPPDKSVKKAKKAPVARAIRSCQSCGTELEPDWMVCPNCERPV